MNATAKSGGHLPAAYAAAALSLLIWGATPAATKLAVDGIDPLLAGILRTVLAAAVVLPLALFKRLRLPSDATGWRLLLASSATGFIGFTILFSLGVQQTSASHAALLNASIPIFAGLFGAISERRVPGRAWLFGMGVALSGEVLLIAFGGKETGGATLTGDLLCLASSVVCGFGYVAGTRAAARIGSLSVTFWGVGLAGLALLPVLYILGVDTDWAALPMVSVWATLYLALGSSVIAYVAWYWALGRGGIVRMTPVQFAMPVVSLTLAVVLLGEPLTLPLLASATIIISGIIIARKG